MDLHFIDAETVHNWQTRYRHLPYFADLSHSASAAIQRKHDKHHGDGLDAAEAVHELVEAYPAEFRPQ